MKKLSKISLVLFSSLIFSSLIGCRKVAPEFGSQCRRLNDCFTAYSKNIPAGSLLKTTIEGNLSVGDEVGCATGIKDLDSFPAIKEQGGCPF